MKTNQILGLVALAGVAYFGYTYLVAPNTNQWTPPPGSMPIYPGQQYGGVTNTTGDAVWLTATGQFINSLGQAFGSIYGAIQNSDSGTPGAGGARVGRYFI